MHELMDDEGIVHWLIDLQCVTQVDPVILGIEQGGHGGTPFRRIRTDFLRQHRSSHGLDGRQVGDVDGRQARVTDGGGQQPGQ